MKKISLLGVLLLLSLSISAQGKNDETGMGIGLSNQLIDGQNYQSIALMPELNLGFFGIGLNIDFRFRLKIETPEGGTDPEMGIEILESDWVLEEGADFWDYLSLYLPKISYLRLGHKGEDFYMKAGQFWKATLGNGTILNNYSNMQFMPETRLFGLALDIDGNMFKFPYVGFESFISNVAAFDLIGGRLFVRPLQFMDVPVVSNIEVGGTAVTDLNPYYYVEGVEKDDKTKLPLIWGIDLTVPVVSSGVFSLNIYGDYVFQGALNEGNFDQTSSAIVAGVGGKIISLVDYNLQYVNQQENYIGEYYHAAYDLNRAGSNYEVLTGEFEGEVNPAKSDLNATVGFEIPKVLYFDASLNSLLTLFNLDSIEESAVDAPHLYPTLKANLHLDDEMIKIVSADFFYLKNGLDSFESIIDPTNALIGGQVNYYTGNTVISFVVDVKFNGNYDESRAGEEDYAEEQWIVNTSIMANIKL